MKISTICYFVRDGAIYLSLKKRGFGKGFLNGYGGKKNPDETLEASLLREVEEESGISISLDSIEQVGIIDFYAGEDHVFQCHIFFIHEWNGDFIESEEMGYPELHKRDSLPFERMWKADKEWLSLICSGLKIRARSYLNMKN